MEKSVEKFKDRVLVSLQEIIIKTVGSQAEVARIMRRDPGQICRILSGRQDLRISTLATIAWACGMKPVITFEPIGGTKCRGKSSLSKAR